MATCKWCHAEITWQKTPAGRFLAVDRAEIVGPVVPTAAATPEQLQSGRRVTIVRRNGSVVVGVLLDRREASAVSERGHEAHWETCPNMKEFRRSDVPPVVD